MKKRFSVLWGALIAFLMTACSALDGGNLISLAGGFVFYDKGGYSGGWRYLPHRKAPEQATGKRPYNYAKTTATTAMPTGSCPT